MISLTNSHIVTEFEAKTRKSKARHLRGLDLFPSGVVHDSRHMKPYPIYIEHARGCLEASARAQEVVSSFRC